MTSTALSLPDDPASVLAAAPDKATFVLVALDRAKLWLTTASDLGEVRELQAQAEAMRVYSRQAEIGRDAENAACEIRLRAERRMGELKADLAPHGGDRRSESRFPLGTLKDLGITKKESAAFQKLAAVPEETFEERLADAKESGRLSRAAILGDRQADYREAVGRYPFLSDMPDEARQKTAVMMADSLDAHQGRPDWDERLGVAEHNADRVRSGRAQEFEAEIHDRERAFKERQRVRAAIDVLAGAAGRLNADQVWGDMVAPDVEVGLLTRGCERALAYLQDIVAAQSSRLEVVK